MHEFNLFYTLATVLGAFGLLQGVCGFLVYVERKTCAYMQDRIGPNRVGPYGLLQVLADGIKFLLKEDLIPAKGDKVLFILAPCIAVTTAMLAFAVVPFGATDPRGSIAYETGYQFVAAPNLDIGIRSSAQIIRYEIPLGLSVLGLVLMAGSLNLEDIIWAQVSTETQTHYWNIFFQPLAFLIFMTSAFAECNRLPFDLPECEQELVGGYHTEYNAMKLALFFIGEYCHMVILFFGGWHFPWIAEGGSHWIMKLIVMAAKVTMMILFYMAIRWTIPRFRFDQLMGLAWKVLIPLALVNLVAVMVVKEFGYSLWYLLPASVLTLIAAALMAGTGNVGSTKRVAIRVN
jgi:NADH-quinone oxidoreductase subunit H